MEVQFLGFNKRMESAQFEVDGENLWMNAGDLIKNIREFPDHRIEFEKGLRACWGC